MLGRRRPPAVPRRGTPSDLLVIGLGNPLIASASPLNDDIYNLRVLEDAGAAAIVLHSLFAEQIERRDNFHGA